MTVVLQRMPDQFTPDRADSVAATPTCCCCCCCCCCVATVVTSTVVLPVGASRAVAAASTPGTASGTATGTGTASSTGTGTTAGSMTSPGPSGAGPVTSPGTGPGRAAVGGGRRALGLLLLAITPVTAILAAIGIPRGFGDSVLGFLVPLAVVGIVTAVAGDHLVGHPRPATSAGKWLLFVGALLLEVVVALALLQYWVVYVVLAPLVAVAVLVPYLRAGRTPPTGRLGPPTGSATPPFRP